MAWRSGAQDRATTGLKEWLGHRPGHSLADLRTNGERVWAVDRALRFAGASL